MILKGHLHHHWEEDAHLVKWVRHYGLSRWCLPMMMKMVCLWSSIIMHYHAPVIGGGCSSMGGNGTTHISRKRTKEGWWCQWFRYIINILSTLTQGGCPNTILLIFYPSYPPARTGLAFQMVLHCIQNCVIICIFCAIVSSGATAAWYNIQSLGFGKDGKVPATLF